MVKSLSEADTRAMLIDPALAKAGWNEDGLRREVRVTDGRFFLVGEQTQRRQPTFADYVLSLDGVSVAVVEAKDNSHHVAAGLQQAKAYAAMLDVKFAYSSNGKGFVEFDYQTNEERMIRLDQFPPPAAVRERLARARLVPSGRDDPLAYPYNTSRGLYPRYYQDVAVRRVLRAMAEGQKRLLLALATGTGKTFIASQLAWKLYNTRRVHRILFLTDRVFLRNQAFNDFGFFASTHGDPRYAVDGELAPHGDIYFGIYQSLYSSKDGLPLYRSVPSDFFDLVIIDECHRSGFGTWREILDYFGDTVQIGLTATPKRTDNVDTYAYFGEPVYSYSLGQGIDDGFLATYKVHRVRTNLDERGGVNVEDAVIAGAELFVPEGVDDVKDFYGMAEFERTITLPDWTDRICEHLVATLNSSDPMGKTMVFCVSMEHASAVRQQIQNRFAFLGIPNYAARIVSEEAYGSSLLEEFRDPYKRAPVVVTTVDLLTTGVDIPCVRNIVFMKPVGSVVAFKQIVGRGTRLDPVTGKSWFRIIDYTGATRLFDDWDRPLDDAHELPAKPWTGVIRLAVLDAETAANVSGPYATAVAAPNEQVLLLARGQELVAEGLPEMSIPVVVGATDYATRTVRIPARPADSADLAVIQLRRRRPSVQRIELLGVHVEIADETILTVDAAGRQMTIDQYRAYCAAIITGDVDSPTQLRQAWLRRDDRLRLLSSLEQAGVQPQLLADLAGVPDADTFDSINHTGFAAPLVRKAERVTAFRNHHSAWLASLNQEQREIVWELLRAYADGGAGQLQRSVLRLDRFESLGGAVGVLKVVGGTAGFDDLIHQMLERLYPAEPEAAA